MHCSRKPWHTQSDTNGGAQLSAIRTRTDWNIILSEEVGSRSIQAHRVRLGFGASDRVRQASGTWPETVGADRVLRPGATHMLLKPRSEDLNERRHFPGGLTVASSLQMSVGGTGTFLAGRLSIQRCRNKDGVEAHLNLSRLSLRDSQTWTSHWQRFSIAAIRVRHLGQ